MRLLSGDFNCYDSELDKFGGNVSIAKYLSEFKSAFSLVDVWRKRHPRVHDVSWLNDDSTIGSRLDKFLVSARLVELTGMCEISPCCMSDHDFVFLSLEFFDSIPRGPGVWKINNSLLDDDAFCEYISERISDLASCKFSFGSVKSWWFFLKSLLGVILLFPLKLSLLNLNSLLLLTVPPRARKYAVAFNGLRRARGPPVTSFKLEKERYELLRISIVIVIVIV